MENSVSFLSWFQKNYHHFTGIFFDIDGTMIRQRLPLDGAREVLEFIKTIQFPYLFLTNDACHSHQEKSAFLQVAHLPIVPEDIVSSGDALRLFARQYQVDGQKFFIMGELGNPNYAEQAGLTITRNLSEVPTAGYAGVLVCVLRLDGRTLRKREGMSGTRTPGINDLSS